MKTLMLGLLCLCLLPLVSCSTSQPIIQIETVYIKPPAALLRELPATYAEIATNLDLVNYALELRYIIEELNADKRALKTYYEKEN